MIKQTYIIIVDDNHEDRELIRRAVAKIHGDALKEYVSAEHFKADFLNTLSADFFEGNGFPNLLFLDLRMEDDNSGIEILKEVRASDYLKLIPVIIISSSENHEDVLDSFSNGANLYLVKGDDPIAFTKSVKDIVTGIMTSGLLPSNLPHDMIFKQ
jgi:two-component system response regulator